MTKMKAVRFYGPNDLRIDHVDLPKPNAGEVVVNIATALTCGTDFKAYRQGHPVLLNNQIPAPFGHEFAGTIHAVGPNVKGLEVGEPVVAVNSAPCDSCPQCKNHKPNLCQNRHLLNGAYAEYICIPQAIVRHNLYKLEEDTPFEVAAMTEPLACVVRALDQMQIQSGQTLAILGCGFMGLMMTQLAKGRGLRVIAIGRNATKLEMAKSLGADVIIQNQQDSNILEAIHKEIGKNEIIHHVVEAIGKPQTWTLALDLVSPGGTVCFYGGCAKGSKIEIDTHRLHYQELKLVGVFHHTPKHVRQALSYLMDKTVDAHRFLQKEILKLDDLPRYFQENANRSFWKSAVKP